MPFSRGKPPVPRCPFPGFGSGPSRLRRNGVKIEKGLIGYFQKGRFVVHEERSDFYASRSAPPIGAERADFVVAPGDGTWRVVPSTYLKEPFGGIHEVVRPLQNRGLLRVLHSRFHADSISK